MAKEKTISDFTKAVIEAKQKFLQDKINYGWDYTIKEESLENIEVFWICNTLNAKKIIFDKETNFLWDRDLYMNDIKTLMKMSEGL